MIVKFKSDNNTKPIEKWSSKDFMQYYNKQYNNLTGSYINIPPPAWPALLGRIKNFLIKNNIGNVDYKHFIDKVFDVFYKRMRREPAFGTIVSDKIYFILSKYDQSSLNNADTFNDDYFAKLQQELYGVKL